MTRSFSSIDPPPAGSPRERSRWRRLLISLAGIVSVLFAVEFAVMGILPLLGLRGTWESAADGLLLAILAAPLLYLLGVRAPVRPRNAGAARHEPRLLRHFVLLSVAAAGAILLLAGSGLEAVLKAHVVAQAESDAIQLSFALRDCEVKEFVPSESQGNAALAIAPEKIPELDRNMRSFLAPFDIVKIKVFDRSARIIYSTDLSIIGCLNPENAELLAALSGESVSKLESKDQVWDLADEARVDIDLVETYVPITGADGRIIGAFEIYKDVTAGLQAEQRTLALALAVLVVTLVVVFGIFAQMMGRATRTIRSRTIALQASEARTRAIVDYAGDGIITIDERGVIESFNAAAEDIFDYAAGEAIGKNLSMLMPSPHREHHGEYLARYLRTGESKVIGSAVEVAARRKDGSAVPIELTVSEIHLGDRRSFTGIIRNITERKRAEQERARLIETEHERNHLKEAVAAQEQLLAVVGHDLRTPLAALRATSELLLTEEARQGPESETFLRAINEEVIRMGNMINDLLEAARLNSGTARWKWGTLRLAEVCRDAVDSIRPLVDAAKVDLGCSVEPSDLAMNGDADAICRLVLNLLSNAQKHTKKGSIHVLVRSIDEPGEPGVEIQVRDTGEGIAPEVADRLGTAFALNAGVVGSDYVQGAGLGLAICKGIVAAHSGTMSIRSALGQGTTVTARLRSDLTQAAPRAGDLRIEQEIAA